MRIECRRHATVELQIGPMVDMVFLLLVFFMVQPQPVRKTELGLLLPGTVEQEEAVSLPDEQRIEIRSGGQVFLNDLPVDGPSERNLPQLVSILERFKQAEAAPVHIDVFCLVTARTQPSEETAARSLAERNGGRFVELKADDLLKN